MDWVTMIGFAGGIAVLVSFAAAAMGRLSTQAATYHVTNLVGGSALVAAGVSAEAWPSVVVNAAWAAFSAYGLTRSRRLVASRG